MQNKALMTSLQNESWAMEPLALNALFQQMAGSLECEILSTNSIMEQDNGVATIKITGSLMKTVPAIFNMFGIAATSYTDIVENINTAASDDTIKSIVLDIDSPGGQVSGVELAADAIYAAGAVKNITAKVDGMAASGAYWLASQAGKIEAGNNAMIGSIGVYSVYVDYSEMAKNLGVDVKIIRSGEHKGMGIEGAPITDVQVEAMQKVIDGMASNFIGAVSRGRQMSKSDVKKIADGRVFIAKDAKEAGLIDKITNNAGASVASAETISDDTDTNKELIMSDEKQIDIEAIKSETQAETVKAQQQLFADLKAEFPDDLAYAAQQFEAGVSVIEAKAEYCDVLRGRLAESSQKVDEAEAKAEKAESKNEESSDDSGTDAVEATESAAVESMGFRETAKQLAKEDNISITVAMSQVAKDQPELYKAYTGRLN